MCQRKWWEAGAKERERERALAHDSRWWFQFVRPQDIQVLVAGRRLSCASSGEPSAIADGVLVEAHVCNSHHLGGNGARQGKATHRLKTREYFFGVELMDACEMGGRQVVSMRVCANELQEKRKKILCSKSTHPRRCLKGETVISRRNSSESDAVSCAHLLASNDCASSLRLAFALLQRVKLGGFELKENKRK